MRENEIIVTYGKDIDKMTADVLNRAGLAALIGETMKKDGLIGLKPNLVLAKPSSSGATTTPGLVDGLVGYLKQNGYHNIAIIEGSWVGGNTAEAFEICGYRDIAKKYGIPLIDTKTDRYISRSYDGIEMEISEKALEVDFMINIPVLKGHCQTKITGALKNMKGCISDKEKRRFHTMGLHKPIACLNKILKQSFVLVDGICGDLDFEEGGNPVQMNRIFCGRDPVLVDAYIASSMGYEPEEVEYITIAEKIGVGSSRLEEAEITVLEKDKTKAQPTSSRKVQKLSKYAVQKDACSACYANLIQALARLSDEGLLTSFDEESIYIGQGFADGAKGSCGEMIGVGKCTKGMKYSVPGCPPEAKKIKEYLRGMKI